MNKRKNTLTINHNYNRGKEYGIGKFLLDAVLTVVTGGIWLIFVVVRIVRWFQRR